MNANYHTESHPYQGNSFFSVEETVTIDETTGRRFVRHVVRHPGGSAVVALVGRDVVCVEQYRPALATVTLELPAGRPSLGETAEDTARRELYEETGFVATKLQPLSKFYNAPCFCDGLTQIYIAVDLEQGRTLGGSDFPTRVARVPIDRTEELVAEGLLVDAKTILGLLLARSWLMRDES